MYAVKEQIEVLVCRDTTFLDRRDVISEKMTSKILAKYSHFDLPLPVFRPVIETKNNKYSWMRIAPCIIRTKGINVVFLERKSVFIDYLMHGAITVNTTFGFQKRTQFL